MTRYSIAERPKFHHQTTQYSHFTIYALNVHDLIPPQSLILWKYIRPLYLYLWPAQCSRLPVRALHIRDLIFPPRARVSKSSQDQSVYDTVSQCWKAEFCQQATICLLIPGRAFHVHDFIFPTSLILWKWTSSLFLLADIQCWKTDLC